MNQQKTKKIKPKKKHQKKKHTQKPKGHPKATQTNNMPFESDIKE